MKKAKRSQTRSSDCLSSPEFAEDELALRFTSLHRENLRYTAQKGCWNLWSHWSGPKDGGVWKVDETDHVFDLVRQVCRMASVTCPSDQVNLARRIASAQTVAAVERLARSDRRHAANVEQWDADPWLLNTPDGAVDLRTGILRPARREDYCTKATAAVPGGPCPLWLAFLDQVTNNDTELQRFLQRMCGYALTGVTREHALFFLYGTGGNGKGVFLNTLSGLLDDYAKTAAMTTFIETNNEQHPTDLAYLQGARFVTASETAKGRRWAEAKIKNMTGGDPISARFMRKDFFTYMPQFKLLISGNCKPALSIVDEAIRRRIYLVPFTVTIAKEQRDKELPEKLRAEWGGILQWMIDGCLAWQAEGLNPPAAVRDATAEYLSEEDLFGQWIEDRCVVGQQYTELFSALYTDWQFWCSALGEQPGSQKTFSQNLKARNFRRGRSANGRGFEGIGLKPESAGQ